MEKKNLDTSQTIFALVTGQLPSAVAIVRLSGEQAFPITKTLFLSQGEIFERRRGLWKGQLKDAQGKILDDILALGFVGPSSFTGEDVIELQCHGSPGVIRQLEQSLVELGARPAERGEFSYRALLNGKLSPSEIENLGDVFQTRDPQELDRIYQRKDSALAEQISDLKNRLIHLQAIFDTAVDFSEEYSSVIRAAIPACDLVIQRSKEITHRYSSFLMGSRSPRLVLAGRPNAGKSSLFNALLCRYRAIVHENPGTTRDVIEEDVWIGRRVWKLVDTAGFRKADGAAELEGISLGEDFLAASSLWLLVVDGAEGMSGEEWRLWDRFHNIPHLVIWNKSDLAEWKPYSDSRQRSEFGLARDLIRVSARTGEGLGELWNRIRDLSEKVPQGEGPLPTATQSARLSEVVYDLEALRGEIGDGVPPEFLSERNRRIIDRMSAVMGEVSVDEVMGRIFTEFCIGK